jgi:hypothetical protein
MTAAHPILEKFVVLQLTLHFVHFTTYSIQQLYVNIKNYISQSKCILVIIQISLFI